MNRLPHLISVDDHVLEPPDLWWERLPKAVRENGPHVRRERGFWVDPIKGVWKPDPEGRWADVWYYESSARPLHRGAAHCGYRDESTSAPITYDEVLPGAWQRDERLEVMDENHTEASICFPNLARFCGQIFLEAEDKAVALQSLRVYNDWMIDEWCGVDRPARLIPLTLVPLWDPELAAEEVRRCADKGSHAVTFSEGPTSIGLPSIYSDYWDPFFRACTETDTVINLHVGTSSNRPNPAPDAPVDVHMHFLFMCSQIAFSDWLYSGVLEQFGSLRVVLSEGQVGWMPFVAQRLDNIWLKTAQNEPPARRARELPSRSIPGRMFGCIFDDLEGLLGRDRVGVGQILIETDFPHTDSTWPHSGKLLADLFDAAGLDDEEIRLVTRGNATAAYRLDRYFGITG